MELSSTDKEIQAQIAGSVTTPMAMLDALNPEQRNVVADVLDGTAAAVGGVGNGGRRVHVGPRYCVLGPPGTGKTLTVVSAAAAVLESDPNAENPALRPGRLRGGRPVRSTGRVGAFALPLRAAVEMVRREIYELRTQFKEKGKFWDPGFRLKHHQAALEAHFFRTMVRVNDPRRDAASVKKDVERLRPSSPSPRSTRGSWCVRAPAPACCTRTKPHTRDVSRTSSSTRLGRRPCPSPSCPFVWSR